MKKLIGILCAVVLIGSAASANAMYGGFKVGANFANLAGDDVDDTDMRTGLQGGVFLGKNFTDQFGGRIELLYVQKGAKEDIEITPGVDTEVTYKFDYVEIPVFLVANLEMSEAAVFNLFLGPTFGFNVKGEAEAEDETEEIDDVKGFEFGAAIGAGLQWYMSSGNAIVFDLRYSLGASSIIDVEDVDVKNRGFGAMIGMQFGFGGDDSME